MAVLKTVLNIAVDTVGSPSVMLRLKDFVLLVCSALGESFWIPSWGQTPVSRLFAFLPLHSLKHPTRHVQCSWRCVS